MKRHFTLIEMLIVVFIIALLAAIGFTVGSSVRKSAMRDAQAAEISKILTACEMFHNDYGIYPVETVDNPMVRLWQRQSPAMDEQSLRGKGTADSTSNYGQAQWAWEDKPGISLVRALSIYSVDNAPAAFSRTDLTTWTGDYLKKDEVRVLPRTYGGYKTGYIIDTYGFPIAYWLRYKDGVDDYNHQHDSPPTGIPDGNNRQPSMSLRLQDRLTPEIWSFGEDHKTAAGSAGENGLLAPYIRIKIWEDFEAGKLPASLPRPDKNAGDLDNIGGDYNHVRK
ncbi:hypothetical protein AGMMS49959_02020 [Planctomycetales bacterium]|nr:hypothetical protein AGMMS49959_02020 [Planctomycetales bacterium]